MLWTLPQDAGIEEARRDHSPLPSPPVPETVSWAGRDLPPTSMGRWRCQARSQERGRWGGKLGRDLLGQVCSFPSVGLLPSSPRHSWR